MEREPDRSAVGLGSVINRVLFRHLAVLVLTVEAMCGMLVRAQFTTASLGGVVRDSSGGAVPDARVTVRNRATGLSRASNSDGDGTYLHPALPVGEYRLTVEKPGFATYQQEGITLTVGQAATQNVTLQLNAVTQEITVIGDSAVVNTQTASVIQVVAPPQVIDLPLNGRQAQALVFLGPGAHDSSSRYCLYNCQGGVYPGAQEAAINGGGTAAVNYLMDGVGHNDSYVSVNLPFPNPDAIQEFNLQTSNMPAEYGNANALVNIVTKSGTNAFHGSAFEFLRNGGLNARNFFAPEPDTLKRNQFGGTLGGPIQHDKLFFFGTYQATRIRTARQGEIGFVPTAAERNGDLSAIGTPIVDPASGMPFPGNQIPLARFSTPSNYFLARIPLPNGPGGQLTYPGPTEKQNDDQFLSKVDWLRGGHALSLRYFYSQYNQPPDTSQIRQNILAADPSGNRVRVQTLAFNDTFTRSAALVFNTWFGWDQQVGGTLSGDPAGPDAVSFPGAGVPIAGGAAGVPPAIEGLTVGGFFNIATGHWGQFNRGDWRAREVATAQRGSHELSFGGEPVRLTQDVSNTNNESGTFQFTGELSGSNLADFFLGEASQFQQAGGRYQNIRGVVTGLFVQDNWRMTSRLVLNAGLRWEPFWPFTDIRNRVACYVPGQKSQRYPNAPAGLLYGGDPGCPAGSGYHAVPNDIAPRLGFALRLDDKTSLRGGGGIYFDTPQTSMYNGTGPQPFNASFTLNGVSFADPYQSAGMANPFPQRYGTSALPGPNVTFALPVQIAGVFPIDFHSATMATWNLTLEHQLRANWLLSAAYVGNSGYHLNSNQYGRRQINPAIYIPGASTVANTQARRIDPDFSTIALIASDFNSSYQALQLNAGKRFNRGLQLLANYTWGKMIDDFAAPQQGNNANPFDRGKDRGPSADDVPHLFHFSPVWQIPVPKWQCRVRRALQGWALTSITTWQSGFPFSVFSGVDHSFSGIDQDYADYVGPASPWLQGQTHAELIEEFFNTSVFVPNAVGTFGNTGKNILRGPRFFNTNLAAIKATEITDRVHLQFRTEFFNVFNNVAFGNPASVVGQPNFGKITSAGDPRILQLVLKLTF
jgi:hypothetical protein